MYRQHYSAQQEPASVHAMGIDRADIVIIGNGIAGLTAAVEARHLAPDKRIVMITNQLHPTINTPALKQFAINKLTRDQLLAYPAGTERAEHLHVVNATVQQIEARQQYVLLDGQQALGYESLLIATGATPSGLPAHIPGRGFDGVVTLHRLPDYLDLRRRLPEVNAAVVVGSGVHAIETVMSLLHWGIRTHWLIRGKTFMSHTLDEVSSELILRKVGEAGALIHLETELAGIVGRVGAVAGVITQNHEMLPCQLVVTCTGTQPVSALARNCSIPLMHQQGILVDDWLRTSVPGIYAAGDVAALRNPQTGQFSTRAQWYSAVAQGRAVGAMMAGHTDIASQPFGVHWHATHLGDLSLLTIGSPLASGSQITTLTDTSGHSYRRLALVDDRLVGYLSLGLTQPDSLAIKRMIDQGDAIGHLIKPLLKGNFDARVHHAARRQTAAASSAASPPQPVATPVSYRPEQERHTAPLATADLYEFTTVPERGA